jgi:hypothetical protein
LASFYGLGQVPQSNVQKVAVGSEKWQMFQSSTEVGGGRMSFKSSNVENAKTLEESLKKPGVVGDMRNDILMEQPQQQYAKIPSKFGYSNKEVLQSEKHQKLFDVDCCSSSTNLLVPLLHRSRKRDHNMKRAFVAQSCRDRFIAVVNKSGTSFG